MGPRRLPAAARRPQIPLVPSPGPPPARLPARAAASSSSSSSSASFRPPARPPRLSPPRGPAAGGRLCSAAARPRSPQHPSPAAARHAARGEDEDAKRPGGGSPAPRRAAAGPSRTARGRVFVCSFKAGDSEGKGGRASGPCVSSGPARRPRPRSTEPPRLEAGLPGRRSPQCAAGKNLVGFGAALLSPLGDCFSVWRVCMCLSFPPASPGLLTVNFLFRHY